jgi:hypothetical protein
MNKTAMLMDTASVVLTGSQGCCRSTRLSRRVHQAIKEMARGSTRQEVNCHARDCGTRIARCTIVKCTLTEYMGYNSHMEPGVPGEVRFPSCIIDSEKRDALLPAYGIGI